VEKGRSAKRLTVSVRVEKGYHRNYERNIGSERRPGELRLVELKGKKESSSGTGAPRKKLTGKREGGWALRGKAEKVRSR